MFFDFNYEGKTEEFSWEIPGIHNVENATAAIAILHSLGIDFETIKKGFRPSKELKEDIQNILLPTEKSM
jgi:UDP-N-acetylmuramate--alanine ligase